MPRRDDADADTDADAPRRRPRRREEPKDYSLWIVGGGVAAATVVVVVLVLVFAGRSRTNVTEEVTEDGQRVITRKSADGMSSTTQVLPPADGRPIGTRHDKQGMRSDQTVIDEGWKLMRGRWERTDETGDKYVADFRDGYAATVTLRFAEGVKTAEYRLADITDHTNLIERDKSVKRDYSMRLRFADDPDKTVSVRCVIMQDGTLKLGPNDPLPYRRVGAAPR